MSVARNTEISSTSRESFEDAIRQGLARATRTLRNLQGAWIKEQQVQITDGQISGFKVNMLITFVLDE
jgi:dodecin